MRKEVKIGLGLLALYLLAPGKANATAAIKSGLSNFLPPWEAFSARPYWDVKQWSWGYGTRVPGSTDNESTVPTGTITPAQALKDMLQHTETDRAYLSKLITRPLSANQWVALLSFSYNLGPGNADNLVPNINSHNDSALKAQWMQYVYVDGVPNDRAKQRRAAEWSLWLK